MITQREHLGVFEIALPFLQYCHFDRSEEIWALVLFIRVYLRLNFGGVTLVALIAKYFGAVETALPKS